MEWTRLVFISSFVYTLLMSLFIYPLWVFIHIAMLKTMKGGLKATWLFFCFFFWSVGAWIYGALVSDKKMLRIMGWLNALVLVVLVVLVLQGHRLKTPLSLPAVATSAKNSQSPSQQSVLSPDFQGKILEETRSEYIVEMPNGLIRNIPKKRWSSIQKKVSEETARVKKEAGDSTQPKMDVLQLKSGMRMIGRIAEETDGHVMMDVPSVGRFKVLREEIAGIERQVSARLPGNTPDEYINRALSLERAEFPFDGRNWKKGFQNVQKNQLIIEYVLEGETVNDWTELVTQQFFLGLAGDNIPQRLAEKNEEHIRQDCPNVIWETLDHSEHSVLYSWSIENCAGNADQAEVARIIQGPKGIHHLHYATKKMPLSEDVRDRWRRLLNQAEIRTGAES